MSADTPYTISIYRDLEQELLHKVFTVWTSNDIPRAEHRDAFNQLKDQGIEMQYLDFLVGYDDIEIEKLIQGDDENLSKMIDEIGHLIQQCSENWKSFSDEIAEKLVIDFENQQPKTIDYGYCESELVLVDILAFISYASMQLPLLSSIHTLFVSALPEDYPSTHLPEKVHDIPFQKDEILPVYDVCEALWQIAANSPPAPPCPHRYAK